MRLLSTLLVCLFALLLNGCARDRLRPETLRCAVAANQDKALWYMANAAHIASGSLIFTKIEDGQTLMDVWRDCGGARKPAVRLQVSNAIYLSVSASGRYAVAGGSATGVEIVNLESGKSIAHDREGHGPGIFSPDERFVLFATRGAGLQVFALDDERIRQITNYRAIDSVYAIAANAPFTRLAVSDAYGKVQLFEIRMTANGLELLNPRTIDDGNREWVSGFAFSATSDELYAVNRDGHLHVWDTRTGARKSSWKTHLNWVSSVTFIRDTKRAVVFGTREPSGMADPAGVVIDTRTGRTRTLQTNQNYLWGAYAPRSDELFITGFWVLPRIEKDISVIP